LPGSWETTGEVSNAVQEIVRFGLPDDHWTRYPNRLHGLDLAGVQKSANETIEADKFVWIVVGDRAQVEQQVKDAGFTNIRFIDADGRPVQ
ncbi:MAG TPA: hypothetical protein VKU40_02045, partial [Thermoanaerobaculia bacterium]|nr:hypothetical protein [Thermoanaerobaculia bacterium]